MYQYKRPYLQPYKGKATRHTCPKCGVKESFTLYLNGNTNKPIHSTVGKCNRESKCGYHYTPKQFFTDNPSCNELMHNSSNKTVFSKHIEPPRPIGTIPFKYVKSSLSEKSNFVRFLCDLISVKQISYICHNYALGATKNKEVIFWQIDLQGNVRTGKIMQYNPKTGKRIKHLSGAINWVHNIFKKSDKSPQDFNLKQCFFGEHLLKLYPAKTVAIVESEKTAVIASVLFPDLNWIAAGNLNGLSIEKCQVLSGRKVILFPDLGAYDKWNLKVPLIKKECKCKISISNFLESFSTPEDKANGLDIADYLINQLKRKKQEAPNADLQI